MSSFVLSAPVVRQTARPYPAIPRWAIPSFADCFFLAVLIWLFVAGASGWKALLMDGDAGWHIRTGEYILDHRTIPTHDLFSFSKAGAPWFAWEWLADVALAILFRAGGLKAVVLFSGSLIALYATVLLRFALWRGANVMLALPCTLLAVGSSSMHFLARPHLFTLLLLPIALWIVEADRKAPGPMVWTLVPLTALWTNLHGGFALLLVCLALMVLGIAAEGWTGRAQWSLVVRYGGLTVACTLATLLNPQGIGLHRHILEYLGAGWIRDLIQEFQAPAFRSEGQLQFEFLLIAGVMLAARLLQRRRFVEALWILFLAHSALTSVRHAPLYAAVAAPLLAAELSGLWRESARSAKRSSLARILLDLGTDLAPVFRRNSVWPAAAIALLACLGAPLVWPRDFPSEVFPTAVVHRNREALLSHRVLTTDQWGDYLIYSFYPRQKVFIDGRSDFYGEALARDYMALVQGTSRAEAIMRRQGFDAALLPVDWPLAAMLKSNPAWEVREDDGYAIFFVARAAVRAALFPGSRANETNDFSRMNNRRSK